MGVRAKFIRSRTGTKSHPKSLAEPDPIHLVRSRCCFSSDRHPCFATDRVCNHGMRNLNQAVRRARRDKIAAKPTFSHVCCQIVVAKCKNSNMTTISVKWHETSSLFLACSLSRYDYPMDSSYEGHNKGPDFHISEKVGKHLFPTPVTPIEYHGAVSQPGILCMGDQKSVLVGRGEMTNTYILFLLLAVDSLPKPAQYSKSSNIWLLPCRLAIPRLSRMGPQGVST